MTLRSLFCAVALTLFAWTPGGAEAETIRLRDLAGQDVVLQAPAKRVLLGEGRFIHALALLERNNPVALVAGWMGEFKRLDPAGYAQYVARFPETEQIPVVGASSAETFSVESALALRPDLVVLGAEGGHAPSKGSDVVEQFARAGVPVLFIDFRAHPLKNTAPSLRLLGQAIGREKQAEEFLAWQQERIDRIARTLETAKPAAPTILMEMRAGGGRECCGSPGNGNLGDFIDFVGGTNIGKAVIPGPLGPLNLEYVLQQDPAVYVATGGTSAKDDTAPSVGAGVTPEKAMAGLRGTTARPGIRDLTAVKEGRAHALWHNFYNSPYNILALEALARWVHPELFADVDPAATLAEMNRRFLAVPLEGTYWTSLK
ncbi:ABC transporter substrate-binding protein [Teichococcus oryzae]|uniref:ABC transporter substrate-binding protein n=1 Tax=Teichococcus oryzae TaxID=1608942 RepID=A0A5B2TFA6_9PROT|nr:ABC transporter substrate-binding protein [Pseudoroseomonas oryzae]KAA2213161.1 ABC transporter substrate-binding protein [Pseudoroseomonas oryzae]